MKYLEIQNNKAYFRNNRGEIKDIDKITREDLYYLIDKAFTEEFEYDKYESDKISNQAHNIIYKNITEKISDLISRKTEIEDEINGLYKDAVEKYCEK